MGILETQRRRIRAKSVLLSGYRKNARAFDHWLKLELAKAVVPVAIVTAAQALGWVSISPMLAVAIIGIFMLWVVFVYWNAWDAFHRLDKRRLAYLRRTGVECDLVSLSTNRRAWAAALQGRTMHDVLKGGPRGTAAPSTASRAGIVRQGLV